MEGGPEAEDRGLNFRAVALLFSQTRSRQGECHYDIHLSMTEVYLEQIRDLLTDKPHAGGGARLEVKQGVHGSHIPGLVEAQV